MDELLADLNTDTPLFEPPALGNAFADLENGFMNDQGDENLYSSIQPDITMIRQSAATTPLPTTSPPAPSHASEIYLDVDADIPKRPKPDMGTPLPTPPPKGSFLESSKPTSQTPVTPDPPADATRRKLRSFASSALNDSWRAARNNADFVAAVRQQFPRVEPKEADELDPADGDASPRRKKRRTLSDPNSLWQLATHSEGAVLDALFMRLVQGPAASTRLMGYLSYTLVTGIVSQRAVVSTCLIWIHATPDISDRVLQSLARLMAQIIPHYRFSLTDNDLTAEAKEFLGAFMMILKCTAKTPSMAPQLVSLLSQDRVIALVRACARRIPIHWQQIDAVITELESPTVQPDANPAITHSSAYSVAPELKTLIPRLRKGLCVGIPSLASIAKSSGNLPVPPPDASLPIALQTAFTVTLHVFGTDIANALRDLWSQREGDGGDYPLLVALEKATKSPGSNNQSQVSTKYNFKNKVRACEAIVRFLAERSSAEGASEKWKGLWGGKERLGRIICDAIPQVKNDIRSESGALLVAMAVTCCAAMCLGPALRIEDANDGVDVTDPDAIARQEKENEEVEETMGELISFAVGSLEEAATAEEVPLWRSFGLWLLLLMSRSGCMLRASGCEHTRAARVLRAWGGMPTGTPGSHSVHGSSHKHSNGNVTHGAQGSSSSWAVSEGVTMFAASSSLAIIDASDVSGSDSTIRALCDDHVQ